MNSDKAYLLGIIIGGGVFGSGKNTFTINFPYKQWGDIQQNPQRAGQISRDIMQVIQPLFSIVYGLMISYQITPRAWIVTISGDITPVINDLNKYGIKATGEIRKVASISRIAIDLIDDNIKRRFIAGLADTIGSTAKSHRKFTDDVQILSFEINGFQYQFVCELCQLLYSVKCYPDQVLWNHPNFHGGNDPYYMSWKKGFKLRVKLDQYAFFGAFAFKTKAESASVNRSIQNKSNTADKCENVKISGKQTTLHRDNNWAMLPNNIRGGIYLHHKHVCAVLGCPHAPYNEVLKLINDAGRYINPFPILCKDDRNRIYDIVNKDSILKNRHYTTKNYPIDFFLKTYFNDRTALLWGTDSTNGYPVSTLIDGLAFLLSANKGTLMGKRTRGNREDIIHEAIADPYSPSVILRIPDLLSVLIAEINQYAILIGAINPKVYEKLIIHDKYNPYKISIRPIKEQDLLCP